MSNSLYWSHSYRSCSILSSFLSFVPASVNRFLTKLLTEDLPRLFVRPKKIVLDFQKGEAVGPLPDDFFKSVDVQEKNKDYVGELSVTLVDARNLSYVVYGEVSYFGFTCSY